MWRCAWPAARGQKVLLAPFESARGADARIQSFLQRPGCCLHCPAGAAALLAKVSAQAWCAGFGCLQHQHGKGIARQGGWLQSLPTPALGNHPACHAQKKPPMKKTIKTVNGWGGRRKGAGRPAGTRNKPRLIHGLPETDDPLQWLLALMAHESATLRQRMAAAKALMPYMHLRIV